LKLPHHQCFIRQLLVPKKFGEQTFMVVPADQTFFTYGKVQEAYFSNVGGLPQ
jgi:hypothetical protein